MDEWSKQHVAQLHLQTSDYFCALPTCAVACLQCSCSMVWSTPKGKKNQRIKKKIEIILFHDNEILILLYHIHPFKTMKHILGV